MNGQRKGILEEMDRTTDKPGVRKAQSKPTFIDLFAGCGGLSLGLCQAGWQGLFAVERATDAFETFKANFLSPESKYRFDWPKWLGVGAHSIEDVLDACREDVSGLRGKVNLIAGGPPCQGFSFAGKRNASDPRNKMFQKYVQFVDLVRPEFLVLENVPGMKVAHRDGRGTSRKTYYQKLIEELDSIGYSASGVVLDSAQFGVPQRRERLVVIGVNREAAAESTGLPFAVWEEAGLVQFFDEIRSQGAEQLKAFGGAPVSSRHALSDLECSGGANDGLVPYLGHGSRGGYSQVRYRGPKTKYQMEMHADLGISNMDSMRLARHTDGVKMKFERILASPEVKRGVNLSAGLREEMGMKKHRTVPMDPAKPAPTLTTLPDDVLHYREPRILTVREYARLQSFPDWFVFRGKYTTGGELRRTESPRYTQIGNAVPPLLGKAIGECIRKRFFDRVEYKTAQGAPEVSKPESAIHASA